MFRNTIRKRILEEILEEENVLEIRGICSKRRSGRMLLNCSYVKSRAAARQRRE
jgi:hypothetical protein